MNKVIFEAVGNTIMFVLLALLFTEGIEFIPTQDGVSASVNIFALIFAAYMLVYLVVLIVWNKKQGAPFYNLVGGLKLHKDTDERESTVTLKASRTAYSATIIVLAIALVSFLTAHVRAQSFLSDGVNVDMFDVGCWIIVLSCIAINIAFSVAWCIEDSK